MPLDCTATDHIERFKDLALVRGTISVHRERYCLLLLVLRRKSQTCSNGHLSTDDTSTLR